MATKRICRVDGCGKPHKARGVCNTHYRRVLKYGSPLKTTKVPPGVAQKYIEEVIIPHRGAECLDWPFKSKDTGGYPQVGINYKKLLVHRIVCTAVHGEPPTPAHIVAHSCGRGKHGCLNPDHLRWATRIENEADKTDHGTHHIGQDNPCSKISDDDVSKIRGMRGRFTQKEIAWMFGISQSHVCDIQTGRRWSHLPHP